jgi:hypothetical protein
MVRLMLSHEMDRLKSKLNEEVLGQTRKAAGFPHLACSQISATSFVDGEVYIAQSRR